MPNTYGLSEEQVKELAYAYLFSLPVKDLPLIPSMMDFDALKQFDKPFVLDKLRDERSLHTRAVNALREQMRINALLLDLTREGTDSDKLARITKELERMRSEIAVVRKILYPEFDYGHTQITSTDPEGLRIMTAYEWEVSDLLDIVSGTIEIKDTDEEVDEE